MTDPTSAVPEAAAAPASTLAANLADAQLIAYNAADLEAFAACFHPDVTVLDHAGAVTLASIEVFRVAYGRMFASHVPHAEVDQRLCFGLHVIERERWSRVHRETGERTEGELLVRYTVEDGLIRWVEFLR